MTKLAFALICVALFVLGPLFTMTAINTVVGSTVITPGAGTWLAVLWLQLLTGAYFSMASKGK